MNSSALQGVAAANPQAFPQLVGKEKTSHSPLIITTWPVKPSLEGRNLYVGGTQDFCGGILQSVSSWFGS
jgi:hypothetical protein